jgi:site-specific recombinase XerD
VEEAAPTPKKRRKKKLPKVLSRREAADLLALVDNGSRTAKRDLLILLLMYRAGLRVSEAVSIKPRDLERDGVIHLYDAKGGDGTAYFTPEAVLPTLDAYLAQRATWLGPDASPAHPLIVNPDGLPVTVRYVQRLVARLKAQAGIVGIVTPHVFRHTFATELIEDGFPLHEVQRLLRHANIATTEVYLHVRDEPLRAKMARRTSTNGREDTP